jgi:hypothetical protein
MFTISRSLTHFIAFGLLAGAFTSLPEAHAQTIVWQQSFDFFTFSDWGPSQRSQSGSINAEIADDFDVVGTIDRIDVDGYGVAALDAAFKGVYVHFYAYGTDNLPGALQAEYFIPKGDPRILNPDNSSNFRIELGSAFQVSGKHFVSVQVSSDSAWYWRSADDDAPRGTALYYRNPSVGQPTWSHNVGFLGTANDDTSFTLYGTRTLTAPTVTALSATTLAQAGRLKISGSGFGAEQGSGLVKIGGATAPVSNWTETSITAYVPDASPLGPEAVQVVTSGGTSNTLQLTVTARPATAGHVQWRFQADSLYIQGRAGVGPDGTIYALDVDGHLYALTPSGGVKWIFNTGPVAIQSVEVGPDGIIYFASSVNKIYAVNPDGTLKWTVTDPSGAQVGAGPDVGPDGNIYAVAQDAGLPNGLGEITISPAGQVLTNRPGYVTGRGAEFRTREIVFGATNQFYFDMNNIDNMSGLQFFQLGGNFLFARLAGGADSQPAVEAGGNIYSTIGTSQLSVFSSSGALLRSSILGSLTAPNVGSDGTIYIGANLDVLALNPDLSTKWRHTISSGAYFGGGPVVNSAAALVVVAVSDIGAPGFVQGIDASTGNLSWQAELPAENGGFVRAMSRARFSPDGSAAYIGMDVNDSVPEPYTYLYAFDTGAGAATDTVKVIAAQYTTARHSLQVQATSTSSTATLQVFVTSTDTLIGTLTKKGAKYTGKFSWPTNPQSITVKSSAGGSATATVTVR